MAKPPDSRVIVVALTPNGDTQRVLATAIRIATAESASVMAVFLNDTDLVRAAALPFTQSTGAFSGSRIALDEAAVVRGQQLAMQEAERRVGESMRAASIPYSFEAVDARGADGLHAVRSRADIVILDDPGYPAGSLMARLRRAVPVPAQRQRPVAVLLCGDQSDARLLAMAARQGVPLLIVAAGIARVGTDTGCTVVCLENRNATARDIASVIAGHEVIMVIASRDRARDVADIESLPARSGAPLVLVG